MKATMRIAYIVLFFVCASPAIGQDVDSSMARISSVESGGSYGIVAVLLSPLNPLSQCARSGEKGGWGEWQTEQAGEIISTSLDSHLEAACTPGDSERPVARLSVRSNIAGARVLDDSVFLGVAPLDSVPIKPGTHILRCISPGVSWFSTPVVETVYVHASESLVRTVDFPVLNSRNVASAATASALAKEQSISNFPVYASTASAVVTGVVAAYFKIRADNSYADFRQNGDPGLLDQVHNLDRASGIALAACQASLLFLTYSLLTR